MATIYISYCATDASFAEKLANALREGSSRNHKVFIDTDIALPGELWEPLLMESLANADAIVLLVSSDYIGGRRPLAEAGAAAELSRTTGARVFPVLLESTIRLPDPIRQYQAIFAEESDFESVAGQIDETLRAAVGTDLVRARREDEGHQRIENAAAEYVEITLSDLKQRERLFVRIAVFNYLVGLAAMVVGVAYALTKAQNVDMSDDPWAALVEYSVLNVLILACS